MVVIPGLLVRDETSDFGTFGKLMIGSFVCDTIELPWRGNRRGKSCAPACKALFKPKISPTHGPCLEEWDDPKTPEREDIKDRDNIQFHAANLAGDVDRGYVSQLLGCIAPGIDRANFAPNVRPCGPKAQKGVTGSKAAMKKLLSVVGENVLSLTICWKEGVLDGSFGSPGGY
ncbi:MAG: DUF5675 family protein [Candidatus Methylomirabilota bacterium]|jgi:hypothetical protein